MAEKIYFMERVEGLLKEKKLTQKELADDLGLRRPTLSDWKKNGAIPAGDICIRIADYLGISVEWLVTGKERGLTQEERQLLWQWKNLTADQKHNARILFDAWTAENAAAEKSVINA